MRECKIDRICSLLSIFTQQYLQTIITYFFNFLAVYIRKCDATAFGYFVFFTHFVFTRFMCVYCCGLGFFFLSWFFLSFVRSFFAPILCWALAQINRCVTLKFSDYKILFVRFNFAFKYRQQPLQCTQPIKNPFFLTSFVWNYWILLNVNCAGALALVAEVIFEKSMERAYNLSAVTSIDNAIIKRGQCCNVCIIIIDDSSIASIVFEK